MNISLLTQDLPDRLKDHKYLISDYFTYKSENGPLFSYEEHQLIDSWLDHCNQDIEKLMLIFCEVLEDYKTNKLKYPSNLKRINKQMVNKINL